MKMKSGKLVAVAAGLSMVLWVATPALAGHGNGRGNAFGFGKSEKHGGGHAFGKAEKHGGEHKYGDPLNQHGNKHGQYRGLERANEVAGAHGQEGRNDAAAHQSDSGSSHGNHDE